MKCLVTILSLAMTLGLVSQTTSPAEAPPQATSAEEDHTFKIFPDPSGKVYFPKDKESYYTRYLSAMKEPSLMTPLRKNTQRVFRFTYLRSFDDPLSVRIVERDGFFSATSVRLKRNQRDEPQKIDHRKTQKLAKGQVQIFRSLLAQEGFWKPFNDTEEILALGGLDGSQWIFEIHDEKGYRMIDVWSPDSLQMTEEELKEFGLDSNELRDFRIYQETGNQLLKLANILPSPDQRY